ncbi:polysaccharide deacetylase [Variovorax sp. J31P207]|uniref:polysaccharide deacetylase family protein n=1 Tax=Variovorax sp. J31P207 TaxID=3053510 RepID=UPI0025771133|nr:polysaccharide deacetylase [Variovorax sp. J31P207]MDM0071587.1 polysaccharide deacetylase [Variovorax sp. J31P207]
MKPDKSLPRWPEGHRSAVALAFDLDGPTGVALMDGSIWSNPSFFTLGSYDPWRALPYLLGLLRERGLPATFFVPSWLLSVWPKQCSAIVEHGHEIAYHGWQHEAFWRLNPGEQREVMQRSRDLYRNHLGVSPIGFRTPSGDWTAETVDILLDAGVTYSSSMRGDDRPYFISGSEGSRSIVEIPSRWDLDDYAMLAYQRNPDYPIGGDRSASYQTTLDNWCREFDGSHREGLCLTSIFHPKVSARPGRLLLLEKWFMHMQEQQDVWFATCAQVAHWWREIAGTAERRSAQ